LKKYKYVYFGTGTTSTGSWDIGQAKVMDGWEFNVDGNREGWTAKNVSLDSGPSSGKWIVTASANDPQWVSPNLSMQAFNFPKIVINMANQNSSNKGKIYFKTNTENYYSEDKSVSFTVDTSGVWKTYTVDLSVNSKYTGLITGIRVDPIESGNSKPLGIDYIRTSN
jgi:hypothetical protein